MFRPEQQTTRGDIPPIRTYTNTRSSPARSAPQTSSSPTTTYYSITSASNGWSNQFREYPNSTTDRYTYNDREDDKCTISTTKQSFGTEINEEDCISFFSSPTPTPMDPASDGKDDTDSETGVFPYGDSENNTLKSLGPKMRFVSPPPWETQGETYDDDDDDSISISDGFSIFSGRFGPRKHREQEKVSIRSLALASMRTPSPTPTTSSRRSPYGKANPNASQSQVSLSAKDTPWASRSTLESPSSERPSLSFVRDRGGASSGQSTERPLKQKAQTHHSPLSRDNVSSPIDRSDSPMSSSQYTHPYAHPDVIPIADSPNLSRGVEAATHHQLRQSNESDPSYIRRASEPAAVATSRVASTFRKGSAGNLPMSHHMPAYKPMLAKHDETEIPLLPPMPRCETNNLPPAKSSQSSHPSVPFPDSPMNNLMTLEAAQRVKKTSPESPTQQTLVHTGSTLVAGFGLPAGVTPDFEVKRNQPVSPSESSFTIRESKLSTARRRTVSSSKISTANSSPPMNDDIGSTRTLKHKRSGFMKLFTKDKDTSPNHKASIPFVEPIPPVPKRIPPPSLSVVVTSPSISLPEIESRAQQQNLSPSAQEAFPVLPSALRKRMENDRLQGEHSPDFRAVLSAPPTQSTFEGLSLRPMSTAFSANFSELFGQSDNSESLSPPVMPAASKSSAGGAGGGAGSPTTSDYSSRSNSSDYPLTPSSTALPGVAVSILGRQEDTVSSLQTQLVNMQKNHQREIWELESQIKDLRLENEELRNIGTCEMCGKSKREGRLKSTTSAPVSVVDRPRPKVSRDVRSVFGGN